MKKRPPSARGARDGHARNASQPRPLRMEALEDRRLLAVQAFLTPLEPVGLEGSLTHARQAQAVIDAPDEIEVFTVSLDDGQTIALRAEGATVRADLTLYGPSGFVGAAQASETGGAALLNATATGGAGTYMAIVSGADGTTGAFTTTLLLNTLVEAEGVAPGASNDTAASAQRLDGGSVLLNASGAKRTAVLGALDGAADEDYYRITLGAGETASFTLDAPDFPAPAMDLLAPDGATVLATGAVGPGGTRSIHNFIGAASAQEFLVRVSGPAGDYQLVATQGADIAVEGDDTFEDAPNMTSAGAVLGHVGLAGEDDWRRFSVNAGDQLEITAELPGDGPYEFQNGLVGARGGSALRMTLHAPDGSIVASGVDSITHAALQSGDYRARMFALAQSAGEYVVSVAGATGVGAPPSVVATLPQLGASIDAFPPTIAVEFSEPILVSSIQASDLSVGGRPALAARVLSPTSVEFELDPLANRGGGDYLVVMGPGAVVDLQGQGVTQLLGAITVDKTAPQILGTLWNGAALSGPLEAGPLAFEAVFSEDVFQAGAPLAPTADNVRLVERTSGREHAPVAITYDPATNRLRADFDALTEGQYELTVFATDGAIEDAVGNDLDGEPLGPGLDGAPTGDGAPAGDYVVPFSVDAAAPIDVNPVGRLAPAGSLALASLGNEGVLNDAGDVDEFIVPRIAGAPVAAVLTPSAPDVTLSLEFLGGDAVTAPAPGAAAVVPPTLLGGAGPLTARVSGDGATAFTLEVLYNATTERLVGDTGDTQTLAINDSSPAATPQRYLAMGHSDAVTIGFGRVFAIPDDGTGSIVELDPADGAELNRFAAPAELNDEDNALAFDGGRLWFLSGGTPALYAIDPDSGAVIDEYLDFVIRGRQYDALATLGGFVYASDVRQQDIVALNPSLGELRVIYFDSVNPGARLRGGLAALDEPDALIATLEDGRVAQINPQTGEVFATFDALGGATDTGVAIVGDDIYVGATGDAQRIAVYDRQGVFVRQLDLPYGVTALGGDNPGAPRQLTIEPNDTIANAVAGLTGVGEFTGAGQIGDNPNLAVDRALDVDLVRVTAAAGETIVADIDASAIGSGLDPILTLFNSAGVIVAQNDDSDGLDSFIEYGVSQGGDYYVGVSSYANFSYDPNVEGSGASGFSTGDYSLSVELEPTFTGLVSLENENAIPDVDRYTFELTSASGATLDIALAGQGGADFSSTTLRVLDKDGETELASSSSAPQGQDVTNYDVGILDLELIEPGVYTVIVEARTPGDYALLVTPDALFENEPNDENTLALRNLWLGGWAMGALGTLPPPVIGGGGGQTFSDPAGDTFGGGAVQHDLASVSAQATATNLILEATFYDDIAPASAGAPNSVYGIWDLDLDQNPNTGAPSAQSQLAPPSQQGGPLGVEATVFLSDAAGMASVIDAVSGLLLGTAPIEYADRSLTVSIPLDLLSDDGQTNFGTVVGTLAEPTDAAPNTAPGGAGVDDGFQADWGAGLVATSRDTKLKPPMSPHAAAVTALLPEDVPRAALARLLREGSAVLESKPAAAEGFSQLIVATESEPNNSPFTADPVALGFDPGEDPEVNISGSLPFSAPTTPYASSEDDGALPLANETNLTTGGRVVTDDFIGNGPHANTGGDYDWHRVSDVLAGQLLIADVDASQVGSSLDPYLGIYNSAGELLATNDDSDGLDSYLEFAAPADDDYYVVVRGFGGGFQDDPFDPSTGTGPASTGPYSLFLSLDAGDVDYFSVSLDPGDVLSASADGAGRVELLRGEQSGVRSLVSSGQNITFAHPASSPLQTGGDAALSAVIDTAGTYYVAVSGGQGAYGLQLRLHRPELEQRPEGARQTLFVDFDGASLDRSIFGASGEATLSPLASFLDGWGLTPDDEDAVIDAILASVEESLSTDLRQAGANGDFDASGLAGEFDVEILNSRDHVDPFGFGDVSRVVVGGTTGELGIPTIGIAESIDVGNFATAESAVVLLDLLSGPANNGNSLNQFALDASASIIDLIGEAVGNIVVHEAGHFFGAWHTDQFNGAPSIMDQGGFLGNLIGLVGPVWGDGDEVDVDLGADTFVPNEGFVGVQNSLTTVAWGLSTGTADASAVGPTVAYIDPPRGDSEDLELTSIEIGFSEAITTASALDPGNYQLIAPGENGVFESGEGDDVRLPVLPSLSGDRVVTLTLARGAGPLDLGEYQLTVGGDSSIVDLEGNPLNSLTGPGGGSDTVHQFSVIFNFPTGGDLYAIDLELGERVALFTRTPLGGGAEPLSDLDAEIVVYGPGGTPYTMDTGGLDGRSPLVELLPNTAGTYVVQVRAESGAGEYVLHAAPDRLFGDFNRDLVVDARDYLMWRETLGRNVTPGEGADADYDGRVGAADYQVWQAHVGESDLPQPFFVAQSQAATASDEEAKSLADGAAVLLGPNQLLGEPVTLTAARAPAATHHFGGATARDDALRLLLAAPRATAVEEATFDAPDDGASDDGDPEADDASLQLAWADFGRV